MHLYQFVGFGDYYFSLYIQTERADGSELKNKVLYYFLIIGRGVFLDVHMEK